MNELRDDRDYFLLTGPMGGYQDPRLPGPRNKWDLPWTAECSEKSVRRFLAEAKYYLKVYNAVLQHFAGILPYEKYLGADSDQEGKDRLSYHGVLRNAHQLEILLNSKSAAEGEDHKKIDSDVDKSVKSVREQMASSMHESENTPEAKSLEELMKPRTSSGPSLISKLKERFTKLIEDEVAKLKTLQTTLPEFAEKNIHKINKFVTKTVDYSDCILVVENAIDINLVKWSAWDGTHIRSIDLREHNLDGANHLVYAPHYVIKNLQIICLNAYTLLKKTNELEKVILNKDPAEYAKLQTLKENIPVPTEKDYIFER